MSVDALAIISVCKSFDGFEALDNLNLTVPQGSVFGLIGPNGAGKTTTIHCIADLLKLDSGEIEIFGKSLQEDPIFIKQKMGILFENVEDLFVYLQGGEHLEFVGQVYGLPFETMEERIDALFRFFEMESHRNIIIDDYSKGMKKKLALASILLHDPDFIILDEPFEGLDTLTIVKIKKLLRKLNERGRTILITSHILSYVEDLCEEVAIIHRGHIIYRNQTEKIRSEFSEEVAGNPALSEHALEDLFLKLVEEENGVEKTLAWI